MSTQQQLLRDEAADWLEIARQVAEGERWLLTMGHPQSEAIDARWGAHRDLPGHEMPDGSGQRQSVRVLQALFLALEAEDELKALTPKKRPAGPSSLRRPRQHRGSK